MAEEQDDSKNPAPKKSKLAILLGILLALAGGGGGFYAVYSGMILGSESAEHDVSGEQPQMVKDMPNVAFVPLEPLLISFDGGNGPVLRFRAQLEVNAPHQAEVEMLTPRVVDVLNSYLRAVDIADLSSNAALVRLRAQMLRRVQVVTGGDRVNDLLIMEFVLN